MKNIRNAIAIAAIISLTAMGATSPSGPKDLKNDDALTGTAIIKFVNATSAWLTFYVDGVKSASVPPGDTGKDLVQTGERKLRAENMNGDYAERTIYVDSDGATWTIYEEALQSQTVALSCDHNYVAAGWHKVYRNGHEEICIKAKCTKCGTVTHQYGC